MELRITNPQENWLTEQILWNNEELKAAIAEKVKDYKTIAYTEDSLKDMKADRADLNKGCKEAQFQLGYKGYIQLAKRSGVYKKINVLSIKEGELISYNPLEEELEINLIEDDYVRENTPTIGYYAMFEEVNGYRHSIYWSKQRMLAHAEKYSFAFYKNGGAKSLELLEEGKIPEKDMWKYSSFWFKDFDAMAHKTMLRQLISKWGTMSIDLQNAIDKDMAVIHEDGKTEYVDAVKAEDDGVVSDQELQEVQEDQPAAAGTQQPDPKGIEASFFG